MLELAHRNSAPGMDIGHFAMAFGEWDLLPIHSGNDVVGVLMVIGNEIHMAIDVQYQRRRSGWRNGLQRMVQPLIEQYGSVVTVVQNEDKKAMRFIERIGFIPDRTGDIVTQYKLTEIKIKKRGI